MAANGDKVNVNTANYQYNQSHDSAKSTTLATLGQGTLTLTGDRGDSQTQGLNRQVNSTNKDLYSVSSQQNINLTVNHQKDLLAEQSKKQKSDLKQKLETGKISQQEYDQQLKYIHNQQLAVNGLLAALGAPTDSVAGQVAAGLSPLAANKIGDYFQEVANDNPDGQLTSTQQTEHVLAHAVLAAAVAATGGNDATTAAIAAGGSEAAAPVLSQALYGTQDPSKLTDEQKDTLTTIADLAGTVVGATTGEGTNAVASGQAAQNAVANNYLNHDEMTTMRDKLIACTDEECRKKVYRDNVKLSKENVQSFISICAKNGTSPACLAKKKELTHVIVESRQGEFDTDGSVPEIDTMLSAMDEDNVRDNNIGPALVAEQTAREAALGYGASEKQAKEIATIAAAAISIIQNKKGKGRAPGALKNTETDATKKAETVVSSGSKDAVKSTSTTQAESVVAKTAAPKAISPTYSELKGVAKGLQTHHIMPQYLGKMLGYTKKDMLDHPATAVTQWTHTGKLNPDALHKAISRYLPPMVGGKKANYTADQIRSGLQNAYRDIGRSDLFDSISHLIK